MLYVIRPSTVDAIQFKYSHDGMIELEKFTGGKITRSGDKRLPTTGGFVYIRIQNQFLIIDDGDFVFLKDGSWSNLSARDFNEFYTIAEEKHD